MGTHETLLAYLVRRLLENGANTSFVHRIADATLPLEELVEDPVQTVRQMAEREGAVGLPHPAIPLPAALYGAARVNSAGLDLAHEPTLAELGAALAASQAQAFEAAPLLGVPAQPLPPAPVSNPADRRDIVGQVHEASAADVQAALAVAAQAAPGWAAVPAAQRAAMLERAADALQAQQPTLIALLVREAGKTAANAVAEVREAVDFLRYDALQLRQGWDDATHRPLGPVVCISPWNFPLAIFTGQVAAALAAGNPVLAKPAEQTPLVAALAVQRAARGRRAARGAATAARPRRDGGRAAGGRCARDGRGLHRLHRRRAAAAAHAVAAPGRRRQTGAADRRDRRAERDGRRLVGAGRAGGGRRREFGLRLRRPALLGAAAAVRAARRGRPGVHDARRRGARAARRRPAAAAPPTSAR